MVWPYTGDCDWLAWVKIDWDLLQIERCIPQTRRTTSSWRTPFAILGKWFLTLDLRCFRWLRSFFSHFYKFLDRQPNSLRVLIECTSSNPLIVVCSINTLRDGLSLWGFSRYRRQGYPLLGLRAPYEVVQDRFQQQEALHLPQCFAWSSSTHITFPYAMLAQLLNCCA